MSMWKLPAHCLGESNLSVLRYQGMLSAFPRRKCVSVLSRRMKRIGENNNNIELWGWHRDVFISKVPGNSLDLYYLSQKYSNFKILKYFSRLMIDIVPQSVYLPGGKCKSCGNGPIKGKIRVKQKWHWLGLQFTVKWCLCMESHWKWHVLS